MNQPDREQAAPAASICPACEYSLAGIDTARCPECGCEVERQRRRRGRRKPVWPLAIVWGAAFGGVGFADYSLHAAAEYYTGATRPYYGWPLLLGFAAVATIALLRRPIRTAPKIVYGLVIAPGILLCALIVIMMLVLLLSP